jgi:hypothetical protein
MYDALHNCSYHTEHSALSSEYSVKVYSYLFHSYLPLTYPVNKIIFKMLYKTVLNILKTQTSVHSTQLKCKDISFIHIYL